MWTCKIKPENKNNYNMGQALTIPMRVGHNKPCQVFKHLQGLGSSQLADHLVNEINQGPWYVFSIYCKKKL